MSQLSRYLTANQAAERLTSQGVPVHAETIKRWAREDRIKGWRSPGGQYLFAPEDVDAAAVLSRAATTPGGDR